MKLFPIQGGGAPGQKAGHLYRGELFREGDSVPTESSGSMLVALRIDDVVSAPFHMPIREGKWFIEAPEASILDLYGAEIDGLHAWPLQPMLALEKDSSLRIVVTSRPLVWIVDSESGLELESASTLCQSQLGTHGHAGSLPHAGFFDVLPIPQPQATPIPASRLEASNSHLFTAEGYTFGSLYIAKEPTSSIISLDPAGTLRLVISQGREFLNPTCSLRLFAPDAAPSARPLYAVPFTEIRTENVLSKVREGDYRVDVSRDAGTPQESSLFSGTIRIERNAKSTLQVRLEDAGAFVTSTPVSFIVTGDDAALSSVAILSIVPTRVRTIETVEQRMLAIADHTTLARPGILELRPVELFPGSYTVELRPLGHLAAVTIPADAIHIEEIALALSEEYTITVTDRESGSHLLMEWCNVSTSELDLPALRRLPPGGRSFLKVASPFSFSAVRGSLRVALSAEGYGMQCFLLDGKHERRFELELEKPGVLRLGLASRGVPFFAPVEWWTGINLFSRSGEEIHGFIEVEGTTDWYSEVLLTSQAIGTLVLQLPSLSRTQEELKLDLEIPSGPSALVLDVPSGTWTSGS